jgi:hypothetical protein
MLVEHSSAVIEEVLWVHHMIQSSDALENEENFAPQALKPVLLDYLNQNLELNLKQPAV